MSCDNAYVLGLFVSLCILYKILDRLVRIPRIGRYGDRFVLVTGCGQGFGFEAVRRLERLGCHVFAGCRRQESVEKLKETFSSRVHPILMDVSNRESVRKAFEYVSSQFPQNTGEPIKRRLS